MIVDPANKTRSREDILANRIDAIVHESFQRLLGKSVGASQIGLMETFAMADGQLREALPALCNSPVLTIP